MRGIYVVNMTRVAVTGAITLIQVKAGANAGLEIVRASFAQSGSTTSTMQPIQINRKSAAATVTSFTPLLIGGANDAAAQAVGSTTATGTNASGEGTDTDVLIADVPNILNGWLYLPVPEERIQVIPGGIVGLKFPVAPGSSLTVTAQVVFRELS